MATKDKTTIPTTPTTPTIMSVTDGRRTIGFVIHRGKLGAEAFTANEKSLGLFENVPAAATACWKHTRGQIGGVS
jgi:hypothetical protein